MQLRSVVVVRAPTTVAPFLPPPEDSPLLCPRLRPRPRQTSTLTLTSRLAHLLASAVVLLTALLVPTMPSRSFLTVAVIIAVIIGLEDPPETVTQN